MYTELILGAELKVDTPSEVIEALKYMIGEIKVKPNNFPFSNDLCDHLFRDCSCYFAVDRPVCEMWIGDFGQCHISTRSNVKNYGQIEAFLDWIKPYIQSGSGNRDMYAITIYEDANTPTIYYLDDNDGDDD